MKVRFTGTPPNFPLGFLCAPFAGGVGAAVAAAVFLLSIPLAEMPWYNDLAVAAAVGFYAVIGSAAYTLLVGGAAVVYVKVVRRVPSLLAAVLIGVAAGCAPFIYDLADDPRAQQPADLWFYLCVATGASVFTAAAFWALSLRNRRV